MILGVFPLLQSLKEFEKDWHKFFVYLGEFPSEATQPWTFVCREFVCFFIEVLLIYRVVLITVIQQSDSVIPIYTFFFYILFHCSLSQDIEYSSNVSLFSLLQILFHFYFT